MGWRLHDGGAQPLAQAAELSRVDNLTHLGEEGVLLADVLAEKGAQLWGDDGVVAAVDVGQQLLQAMVRLQEMVDGEVDVGDLMTQRRVQQLTLGHQVGGELADQHIGISVGEQFPYPGVICLQELDQVWQLVGRRSS